MHELIYTSAATEKMSEGGLISLLEQSWLNNERLDITGLLVYHNREFIQILEGQEERVAELFDKISLDGRHTSVRVCWQNEIEQRNFLNWSMAFVHTDHIDAERLVDAAAVLNETVPLRDVLTEDGGNTGKKLMLSLAKQVLRDEAD